MKIVLTGICQVRGMAEGIRRALPEARVVEFHVGPKSDMERVLSEIRSADLLISQILPAHNMPDLAPERMRALVPKVAVIPPIVFRGFHPGSTIVSHEGAHLESPITDYHSVILIAAHLLGLPIERAVDLHNAYIYAKLGHFAAFEISKAALLHSLKLYELDGFVTEHWAEWLAPGPFMHTPNHPHVRVLAGLAIEVARRAGLPVEPISPDTPLVDALATQNAYAVPEDLARRLGFAPRPLFRAYQKAGEQEEERYYTLERFAESTYEIFRRTPAESLRAASGVGAAVETLTSLLHLPRETAAT